jgi:hypothetical protein
MMITDNSKPDLYETDRCFAADGQRRELAKVRIG